MSSFWCLLNLLLEDLGWDGLLAYTSIAIVKVKLAATPCDLMTVHVVPLTTICKWFNVVSLRYVQPLYPMVVSQPNASKVQGHLVSEPRSNQPIPVTLRTYETKGRTWIFL